MDIQSAFIACNATFRTDDPMLALEFLRMAVHIITPEQFVSYVKAMSPFPEAVEQAKDLAMRCMGTPLLTLQTSFLDT